MSTLSIRITAKQEAFIEAYIKAGNAENETEVVHKALGRFAEDAAVDAVLQAEKETPLYGDLRELVKKMK